MIGINLYFQISILQKHEYQNYNGSFNFNSYGYNKIYDTNITESVIRNDFFLVQMIM